MAEHNASRSRLRPIIATRSGAPTHPHGLSGGREWTTGSLQPAGDEDCLQRRAHAGAEPKTSCDCRAFPAASRRQLVRWRWETRSPFSQPGMWRQLESGGDPVRRFGTGRRRAGPPWRTPFDVTTREHAADSHDEPQGGRLLRRLKTRRRRHPVDARWRVQEGRRHDGTRPPTTASPAGSVSSKRLARRERRAGYVAARARVVVHPTVASTATAARHTEMLNNRSRPTREPHYATRPDSRRRWVTGCLRGEIRRRRSPHACAPTAPTPLPPRSSGLERGYPQRSARCPARGPSSRGWVRRMRRPSLRPRGSRSRGPRGPRAARKQTSERALAGRPVDAARAVSLTRPFIAADADRSDQRQRRGEAAKATCRVADRGWLHALRAEGRPSSAPARRQR